MKKQFVPYKIALVLEDIGFNEACFCTYSPSEILNYEPFDDELLAPLWQQVEEWFREKHSLFINILGDGLNGTLKGLYYSITEEGWINWYESVDDSKWYDTYEEAREAAILEAIKLVKENKK